MKKLLFQTPYRPLFCPHCHLVWGSQKFPSALTQLSPQQLEFLIKTDNLRLCLPLSANRVIIALVRFRSTLSYVLVFLEIAHFSDEIILLVVLTGELLFATRADALDEIFSALLVKPRANLELTGLFVFQAINECSGS